MPALDRMIIKFVLEIILAKQLGPTALFVGIFGALWKASARFRRWTIVMAGFVGLILLAAGAA